MRPVRSRPGAGEHDARADVEAAGHTVGLGGDHAGDAEILAADAQGVAGAHVQADQQVIGYDHGAGVERLAERAGGVELHFAVERVGGGIHGLDGDQQRIGHGLRRRHGDGFGDPGAADALSRKAVERGLLFGRGEGEDAGGEVAGHEGAGLAEEHAPEGAAETAHAG